MWTYITSMPYMNYQVLAMQLPKTEVCIHKADPQKMNGQNVFDEV